MGESAIVDVPEEERRRCTMCKRHYGVCKKEFSVFSAKNCGNFEYTPPASVQRNLYL